MEKAAYFKLILFPNCLFQNKYFSTEYKIRPYLPRYPYAEEMSPPPQKINSINVKHLISLPNTTLSIYSCKGSTTYTKGKLAWQEVF